MKRGLAPRRESMPANSPWFVYLLRCADGSLYAGITTDVARRIAEHNSGRDGARYTRARRPVQLAWQQPVNSRSEASRCEYLLRRLSKAQKEALVAAGSGTAAGMVPGVARHETPCHPPVPGPAPSA
jgi:putative endonuclease